MSESLPSQTFSDTRQWAKEEKSSFDYDHDEDLFDYTGNYCHDCGSPSEDDSLCLACQKKAEDRADEAETLERMRKIASEWHDGQFSALYSFASTGKLVRPLKGYREEVGTCLASALSHGPNEDAALREFLTWLEENHPETKTEYFILAEPFKKFLNNFEGEFKSVTTVSGLLFQIREYLKRNTLEQ